MNVYSSGNDGANSAIICTANFEMEAV